jgi:hypothetical protein
MSNFWDNYPGQDLRTSALQYRQCAGLVRAVVSERLDSPLAVYHCARKDDVFFEVDDIVRFARDTHSYKESTTITVIANMLDIGILKTNSIRIIGGNPFYDTKTLEVRLAAYKPSIPTAIPTSAKEKAAAREDIRRHLESGVGGEIIHPMLNFREAAGLYQLNVVHPVPDHEHVMRILDVRSLSKLDSPGFGWVVAWPIAINPESCGSTELDFGEMSNLVGHSDSVLLFGPEEAPIVNGQRLEKPLPVRKYKIVAALLEKYPGGLLKTELDGVVGGEGGHKDLRELVKTKPWCDVIIRPQNNHSGGTRIL